MADWLRVIATYCSWNPLCLMELLAWALGGVIALVAFGPVALAIVPFAWVVLALYRRSAKAKQRTELLVYLDRMTRLAATQGSAPLHAMYEELGKLLLEDMTECVSTIRDLRLDLEDLDLNAMRRFLAARGRPVCNVCAEVHSHGRGCTPMSAQLTSSIAPMSASPSSMVASPNAVDDASQACPECAAPCSEAASYCARCGVAIRSECSVCEFRNDSDADYCMRCGVGLELQVGEDHLPTIAGGASAPCEARGALSLVASDGQPTSAESASAPCPDCGNINHLHAISCECGTRLMQGMLLKQRIPGYVYGVEPQVVVNWDGNPDSVAWLGRWRTMKNFHRFSLSADHLMAEFDEGNSWFVVGSFEGGTPKLPLWSPPTSTIPPTASGGSN